MKQESHSSTRLGPPDKRGGPEARAAKARDLPGRHATWKPIGLSGAPNQLGKIQFESLIEQFRVVVFPGGDRRVKRAEDMVNLFGGRRAEPAAILPVQVNDLLGAV